MSLLSRYPTESACGSLSAEHGENADVAVRSSATAGDLPTLKITLRVLEMEKEIGKIP